MDLFTESTKMEPHLDIEMDDFIVSTYFDYLHKIASELNTNKTILETPHNEIKIK